MCGQVIQQAKSLLFDAIKLLTAKTNQPQIVCDTEHKQYVSRSIMTMKDICVCLLLWLPRSPFLICITMQCSVRLQNLPHKLCSQPLFCNLFGTLLLSGNKYCTKWSHIWSNGAKGSVYSISNHRSCHGRYVRQCYGITVLLPHSLDMYITS